MLESNNITYGPGAIFLYSNDDSEVVFNVNNATLEFTEEPDTIYREEIKALIANEATIEMNNVKVHRQLWYRLVYGSPWQWPVSNNWLRTHGYDMRRKRQIRKAFPWVWNKIVRDKFYESETKHH